MAYSFDPIFAADPSNPTNVASNAAITIYNPNDPGKAPVTLTDVSDSPIANPVTVNKNGFGPAFKHATLDRLAWSGGGFTGFFTSYEGLKNEAIAARAAAETAGVNAAAAASEGVAGVAANAANAETAAEAAAASAAASAALVNAPADTAIAAAINGTGTQTKAALSATYAPVSGSANYASPAALTKTDTLARIRTRLAGDERVRSMASKPPYDAPVMATPPTITETTALDAALTKSWSQTLTNVFRWDGPTASGSTPQYYNYADGSGRAASVPSTQVAFDTDADKFAVVLYGRTGMKYRLWVNEQATTAGFTTVTNNATTIYLNFDFGSYPTSPRRIVLEIELAAFPIQFFGVRTKPAANVVAPSIRSARAILVGDSFGTGAGALNFLEGYGRTLGRLLGIADFWSHFSSVAATGLVQAASATAGTYGSRLNADVIANAPDLVIIQGSQNDKPHVDLNLIGPALISYVNTLKAALPNCLVIVTGLAWVANPDANHLKINNELRTAATTLGVPFIDLISPVQFFTGTGTTSVTTGDGNADRYRNPDGSHPSRDGHYTLAQVLGGRIREAISRA